MSCPNLAIDRRTIAAPPPSDEATPDSASPDSASPDSAIPDSAIPDSASPDPAGRDSAREALAAIASTYEDARAGIISGDSSPRAEQQADAAPHPLAPTGHSPTVPLTLMSGQPRAEPPQNPPTGERPASTAFWSRLLRRGQPARRGRHSATDPAGLPAQTFEWGPPGRVRFLPQDGAASPRV